MIGILHCVFCKDDNTFDRAKNSLLSLRYIPTQVSIYICGYVAAGYTEKLFFPKNAHVELLEENRGKSHIINRCVKKIIERYILIMDSDIIFESDIVTVLVDLYSKLSQQIKLGILVPNQKQDNRHSKANYSNIFSMYGHTFLRSDKCDGIAGGVFLTEKKLLEEYPFSEVGIYGPDDTLFLAAIFKAGYLSFIVENLAVIHPYDMDESYTKWKKTICIDFFENQYLNDTVKNPSPPDPTKSVPGAEPPPPLPS